MHMHKLGMHTWTADIRDGATRRAVNARGERLQVPTRAGGFI